MLLNVFHLEVHFNNQKYNSNSDAYLYVDININCIRVNIEIKSKVFIVFSHIDIRFTDNEEKKRKNANIGDLQEIDESMKDTIMRFRRWITLRESKRSRAKLAVWYGSEN